MRRFHLQRHVDSSGVSGTGHVADGVVFPDGRVVMCWRSKHSSINLYNSIDGVEHNHGHGGNTEIVWDDPE